MVLNLYLEEKTAKPSIGGGDSTKRKLLGKLGNAVHCKQPPPFKRKQATDPEAGRPQMIQNICSAADNWIGFVNYNCNH